MTALRILVIVAILATDLFPVPSADYSRTLLYSGYCLSFTSLLIVVLRCGFRRYATWITLVVAYPILTPFLILDVLGYAQFSAYATELQYPDYLAMPVFIGGLSCLYLGSTLEVRDLFARAQGQEARKPFRAGKINVHFLILAMSALMSLVFAWLAEPGTILGVGTYSEIIDSRFSSVRFAGGAWITFVALMIASYLFLGRRPTRISLIFWVSVALSITWLFLHARRSEPFGLIIFLFILLFPYSKTQSILNRLLSYINIRTVVFLTLILLGTTIGYYRTTLDWSSLQRTDYVQAPGGSGNNFLTYVAAYYLKANNRLDLRPGETYLYKLKNLPPEVLGLERAPEAYDLVDEQIRLRGGQYCLMEPAMNFGSTGVAVYIVLIGMLFNLAQRSVGAFLEGRGNLHGFLQGSVFLALMFRTLWYGPDAAINSAIIVFIVYSFLRVGLFSKRRVRLKLIGG